MSNNQILVESGKKVMYAVYQKSEAAQQKEQKIVLTDIIMTKQNTYDGLHPFVIKQNQIKDALQTAFLQPDYVQQTMLSGVPEESKTRGIFWQYCLINYSPFLKNRNQLKQKNYQLYYEFLQDMLVKKLDVSDKEQLNENIKKMTVHSRQIIKDLARTQQELNFYKQTTDDYNDYLLEGNYNGLVEHSCLQSPALSALFRVLFVYSSLNVEGYTQGMNELVAVLYMGFRKNASQQQTDFEVEAETYFCFQEMMTYMRPLFNSEDDKCNCGLFACIRRLDYFTNHLLAKKQLHILQQHNIGSHHFAVTWVTSLFSQNLPLPDCERLWDVLLSVLFLDKNKVSQRYGYQEQISLQADILNKSVSKSKDKNIIHYYTLDKQHSYSSNFLQLQQECWIDYLLALCIYVVEETLKQLSDTSDFNQIICGLQRPEILQNVNVEAFIQKGFEYQQKMIKQLGSKKKPIEL